MYASYCFGIIAPAQAERHNEEINTPALSAHHPKLNSTRCNLEGPRSSPPPSPPKPPLRSLAQLHEVQSGRVHELMFLNVSHGRVTTGRVSCHREFTTSSLPKRIPLPSSMFGLMMDGMRCGATREAPRDCVSHSLGRIGPPQAERCSAEVPSLLPKAPHPLKRNAWPDRM